MLPLRTMGKDSPSDPENARRIHTSLHDAGSEVSLSSVDLPPPRRRSTQHSDILPTNSTSEPHHAFSPHVLFLLMPASIFGVLMRLGLVALTTYNGQSVFSLAYVQGLGCFVMGIGIALKEPLGELYPPLYAALTTGFCGSVTTFSSWQLDVFNSWINSNDADHSALRNFIDGTGKSVFTLLISISSVLFGSYIGRIIHPHLPTISSPSRPVRYAISIVSVLIYAATLPAFFLLPASYRHQATAALLFAFPGTLTRYTLSILLNPLLTEFPLGTFAANSAGSGLLAALHVIQSIASKPLSPKGCSIVQGLDDGYCGCLTTISTFAVEVRGLRGWERLRYVLMSWGVGQLLFLVIMGPSLLSGNVKKEVMCKFD
ncbi:hypothetical protein BT96DRAFT_860770 [Gymnopus androsaceus JB14]|uniref:CRCB-domain-containing protein n=1 Tax=Gymnopus androsaceus JB14 TaxID=1447944 RepID=A0A6A4HIA3_9AGAR|nr:hypothetical protein BT96DRAFT_860770 [Gymnopus androsaceus JB14]